MRTDHSVRAIAFDEDDRLILIKRTRPGMGVYWVTPGGGVEDDDACLVSALRRELYEELHAEAEIGDEVLTLNEDGIETHVFVARILDMAPELRTGAEFSDPLKGTYELQCIEMSVEAITALNAQPSGVKRFLIAQGRSLFDKMPRSTVRPLLPE